MSIEVLNEIRKLLPRLTDEELQQVILLATACRTRADKQSETVDWYNALSQALLNRIEWRVPPLRALPEHTQQQLRKTYYAVLDWMQQAFKPPLKRIERQWAFKWLAQMLCDYLLEKHRPLCLNGLLNAVPELAGIVEQSFPGYTQSGLLGWVVKNQRAGGVK